ncbi:hypothetical protein [Thermococcus sp.]|uniref:hypothetical protein n=1 Tax=Thermococcus sp. TaxID=35749 RepID=UPI0026148EBE|nr:hypothetical protein [Thermococcus sp.]
MLQTSKLYQARNNWRKKAIERADEIREYRKTTKRHKETISELKEEIKRLKQELGKEETKKNIVITI